MQRRACDGEERRKAGFRFRAGEARDVKEPAPTGSGMQRCACDGEERRKAGFRFRAGEARDVKEPAQTGNGIQRRACDGESLEIKESPCRQGAEWKGAPAPAKRGI